MPTYSANEIRTFRGKIKQFFFSSNRHSYFFISKSRIDDWYDMTISDVREYEEKMQRETNERLLQEIKSDNSAGDAKTPTPPPGATTPTTPGGTKKGWFNWS